MTEASDPPGARPLDQRAERDPAPPQPPPSQTDPDPHKTGRLASLISAGILLSRLAGLVRQRVFAYYLGNSVAAAIFSAALRIPNFLQNLFGEGVLSASFIPVYARLLADKEQDEADRVAGAVFGLLALSTAALVAAGVVFTPLFVETIAPGFHGETRAHTVRLVRILFPGTGLLVLSAWCLGVLNTHGRPFLAYVAPVLWNGAIVAALVGAALLGLGSRGENYALAEAAAWGAVAGSAIQFGVQVPPVLRLLGRFVPSLSIHSPSVRRVLASFVPVLVGRGVIQISAYVDTAYASLISERAVSALTYAQMLYLLPISVFGMASSAAELPAMSRDTAHADEMAPRLRARIEQGLGRVAFFVVPSAAAFLFLGDVVSGALLQTGRFSAADTRYLWYLLMGSAVGLGAASMGRLYSAAFYALKDTRTPLVFATARVTLTALLAYWSVTRLPGLLGVPRELGAAGITATTGVAAWIEYALLRRSIEARIGRARTPPGLLPRLWFAALVAGAAALGTKLLLGALFGVSHAADSEWAGALLPMPHLHPILVAVVVVTLYGALYFAVTFAAGVPLAASTIARVTRLVRRR